MNELTRRYPAEVTFVVLALLAFPCLQLASAGMTFLGDEWIVFDQWRLTPESVLTPYNEHLSVIPITILLGMLETVGLRSHLAYLVFVHVLHIVTVAGVYVLVRRYLGAWIALVSGAFLLPFGSGAANLFWAFQVGAVASTAAGVWALVLLDRRGGGNAIGVAVLLSIALASSSFGLPFVPPIVALVLAAWRERPWALTLTLLVLTAYGVWVLLFRGPALPAYASGSRIGAFAGAAEFVPATVWYAVAAPLGTSQVPVLGPLAGGALGTAWVIAIFRRVRAGAPLTLALGCFAGIILMGLLIAVARGDLGLQVAGASRYVYVTGLLAVIGVAATLSPGRMPRVLTRRAALTLGAVAMGLAFVLNVRAFLVIRDGFLWDSEIVKAGVTLVLDDQLGRCHAVVEVHDHMTEVLAEVPAPERLRLLVRQFGDPRVDALVPGGWAPASDAMSLARTVMCDTAGT